MSTLVRLLRLSRPRFWLYLAGPVLVGLSFGADALTDLVAPLSLALVAYFLLPANVFLYGVNDVFDADVDRANPKKDEKEVRYRGDVWTLVAVVASLALGVALVAWAPAAARPWLVGFFVLGAAYSAPPLRLKTRPPLDSLSNGLYILPGAAAYAALTGTAPPLAALAGGWLWTMAMHTYSAVPDVEPDRRAGIETLATVLGRDRALAYCAACWLLSAAAFALLDPRAGLLLLVYPALVAVVELRDVDVDRAYWWYPGVNAVVGAVFTVAGLWGVVGA
ncbi:4-hydroxybenzoate polyprenyltransferase [Halomicrobium zhouii]|uniref:4-hydroxybenzoate polyprenyltransferase n=1 Tax=Halomicrobium zhouii TaxID=767519 RepID=A0A1I6LBY8_9EURY|nr:prenyltransferase [Halomicrobium zhouii]SFS01001.1 4-hydroxybenzoate polyprenyltransferase [Halomicrobium zhouii]